MSVYATEFLILTLTTKQLVTASNDKQIKLWSVSNKKFISSFTGHTNWVRCARFSPNGKVIGSCSDDRTFKLFDILSGDVIESFSDSKGHGYNHLAWHPDGTLIAVATTNNRVRIYDIRTRNLIQMYDVHSAAVNQIDFHPSGNFMLSVSDDGSTKILDLLEGRPIFTIKGHAKQVTTVQFSKDGKIFATGGKDNEVRIIFCTVRSIDFKPKKKKLFRKQLMIWNWDIDNKSESPTNISGIQPLSDAEDGPQLDNSIVVTQKSGSHFEDFDRVDFDLAK